MVIRTIHLMVLQIDKAADTRRWNSGALVWIDAIYNVTNSCVAKTMIDTEGLVTSSLCRLKLSNVSRKATYECTTPA